MSDARVGTLLLAVAFGCAVALGCAGGPTPAAGPTGGIGAGGTSLAYDGLALGMTLRAAEGRLGGPLDLRPIEDQCGRHGARVQLGDQEAYLGFTDDSPDAALHTIVLRTPPGATKEELVSSLEERLPGLRYQPSPHWPNMPEEENPKPLYVHEDHPDAGILVGPEEGWIWISFLECMD